MKSVAIAVVLVSALASNAFAHERKAQRSIRIQVEDTKVLMLVTWTSPTGLLGQLMLARAAVIDPLNPRRGLEMLMAQRALAPIRIGLNGRPLAPRKIERKLTFDASSQRLMTVSVLATIDLPAMGSITVEHSARERTKLSWSDRTTARVRAISPSPLGTWLRGRLLIRTLAAAK